MTNRCIVEGNNGGSFIELSDARDTDYKPREGMVHLKVGETCIHTIDQDISVCALAAILTWCKDQGFQNILEKYFGYDEYGVDKFTLDEDPIVARRLAERNRNG